MNNIQASKDAMASTLTELAQRRATIYADVKPSRSGLSARVRLWYISSPEGEAPRLIPLKPAASGCNGRAEWEALYREAECNPETWAWKVQGRGTCRIFEAITMAAAWAGMPEPYGVANAVRKEAL